MDTYRTANVARVTEDMAEMLSFVATPNVVLLADVTPSYGSVLNKQCE